VSESTAKTTVLVVGALMLVYVGLKRNTLPDPYRMAWAAGLITLFLSLLADISPEIAGPLAILLLIAVYWHNKGILGPVLPSSSNTQTATPASPAGGTA
jgi:hypothetical protein